MFEGITKTTSQLAQAPENAQGHGFEFFLKGKIESINEIFQSLTLTAPFCNLKAYL